MSAKRKRSRPSVEAQATTSAELKRYEGEGRQKQAARVLSSDAKALTEAAKRRIQEEQEAFAKGLKAFQRLPSQVRERIQRLLDKAPAHDRMVRSKEGRKAAAVLRELLEGIQRLSFLSAGGQDFRAAGLLEEARERLARFALETDLYLLEPSIRSAWPGRPTAYRWAVLAAALSDELRTTNETLVWQTVTNLLRPYVMRAGNPILCESRNISRLVDRWQRTVRQRVTRGQATETFDQHVDAFRKEAGLT